MYRDCPLIKPQDGDETIIFDSAQALVALQNRFGAFPRIVGKGDYAAVGYNHRDTCIIFANVWA
jgi:hypothetical protein